MLIYIAPMKKQPQKVTKLKFKPAGDRVLVKPLSQEPEKTATGIYIPDTARKEKPERGTIVAVGEGKRTEKGDILPMKYKVGDEVMFSKYGYDELTIDDVEYYVISESNILGTF
jgi:chaperonin GroES